MKKILLWLFVIIVLGVGAAWWAGQQVARAYRGFPGEEVFVEIPQGSGVAAIGERLAVAGVRAT